MGEIYSVYLVEVLLLANKDIVGREHDEVETKVVTAQEVSQVVEYFGSNKNYGEILSIKQICTDLDFINLIKD